jgi:tetratricopeptide (TPR) repeat protein
MCGLKRRLHSRTIREQYEALNVFPEFVESRQDATRGEYGQSVAKMERVLDIVQSSVGPASMMSLATTIELAHQRSRAGLYEDALVPLQGQSFGEQGDMYSRLSQAAIHMREGRIEAALTAAEEATEMCEAQGQANMDLSAFPACYGTLGVCRALVGDADGSEEVLQMAARWSSDATSVLVAMGNLGSLHWSLAAGAEHANHAGKRQERLQEALAYWGDGVDHAVEAARDGTLGGDGGAAAAMCGVTGGGGDDGGMLGPGVKSRVIKNNNMSATADTEDGEEKGMFLEDRLKVDATLAEAYASVLCNMAVAHKALGAAEAASDELSAALMALEGHDGPVLGRVLAEMARSYTSNLQAVQAEGLFRTALDKLACPQADRDPRYMQEQVRARRDYGKLLSQWDKREGEAGKQEEEARVLEAKLVTPIDSAWLLF